MMSRRGFTLIEVLIVIAITSLLAGLMLTYTSTSRDQVALYVEEAKLAQNISRSKSLALATYNRPEVPCGYGVGIDYDSSSYSLFAYRAEDCSEVDFLSAAGKEEISSFALPPNVRFAPPGAASIEDVMFLPPEPRTWIWHAGSLATSTGGEIVLMTPAGSTVTIKVGVGGQITF